MCDLKNLVLTFNLYGTKDSRTVSITKPTLWDAKPAPACLGVLCIELSVTLTALFGAGVNDCIGIALLWA